MEPAKRKVAVAALSVASNAILVILKLTVGLAIGAVSVISEAIHSGVDLLAAAIALFSVRVSGKPADEEHPFGHGKVENISGAVEAVLIAFAGGWIIWEAVQKLIHRTPLEGVGLGVAVMCFSAVANYFVSRMLFRVGKETDSIALQADGWHLRTDVWTSAGVMGGLLVIETLRFFFPSLDLWWLDPVVAIAVALLILKTACELTINALRDVLDASLPTQELKQIEDLIKSHTATRSYHRLRTRRAGAERFIEFHLQVDGELTVNESHRVTQELGAAIRAKLPGSRLTIHVEPAEHAKATEPTASNAA